MCLLRTKITPQAYMSRVSFPQQFLQIEPLPLHVQRGRKSPYSRHCPNCSVWRTTVSLHLLGESESVLHSTSSDHKPASSKAAGQFHNSRRTMKHQRPGSLRAHPPPCPECLEPSPPGTVPKEESYQLCHSES